MNVNSKITEMLERELGAPIMRWHLASSATGHSRSYTTMEVVLTADSPSHAKRIKTHLQYSGSSWRQTHFAPQIPDVVDGGIRIPIKQIVHLVPGKLTSELFSLLATEDAQ